MRTTGRQSDGAQSEQEAPSAQSKEHAQAARAFARALAGENKAKYVQAFQAALNIADTLTPEEEPKEPDNGHAERRLALSTAMRSSLITSQKLTDDPTYIENAARLIRAPNRIVGGHKTTGFPDCVAVGNDDDFCCTGTLIGLNVVLTAGHCFDGCSGRIFIGSDVNRKGTTIRVLKAVRHPDFRESSDGSLLNDLTVLILERNVTTVAPRAMASAAQINAATFVRAVGFGNTDPASTRGFGIKRVVDIPVVSNGCNGAGDAAKFACIPSKELVAGRPLLNKDSCNGDSGGPVYVLVGNQALLAGATSRATRGSTHPCGDGGIYVRVDQYQDFIRSIPGAKFA